MTRFPERVWAESYAEPSAPEDEKKILWKPSKDSVWVSREATQKDIERRRWVVEMLSSSDPKRRSEIANFLRQQVNTEAA